MDRHGRTKPSSSKNESSGSHRPSSSRQPSSRLDLDNKMPSRLDLPSERSETSSKIHHSSSKYQPSSSRHPSSRHEPGDKMPSKLDLPSSKPKPSSSAHGSSSKQYPPVSTAPYPGFLTINLNSSANYHTSSLRPSSRPVPHASSSQNRREQSAAPSQAQTFFKSNYDTHMASRQPQINSLPPAERAEQEKWAQSQLQQHATCAAGWDWIQVPEGYVCTGGGHGVTHELLAEGKGGVMYNPEGRPGGRFGSPMGDTFDVWAGPFYGQDILDIMNAYSPNGERLRRIYYGY
ncbi:hypothetical protein LSUE1_G005318 [Lachnellula suecica]|uniref:Uncharacterized protein n=1 Tax=Lachnellula suecica TaxID=602035 RepID=A0A8T9C4Z4_9HELO|nr:hypothetical protein LSUE1_G005318 [Lachnellula suecica]